MFNKLGFRLILIVTGLPGNHVTGGKTVLLSVIDMPEYTESGKPEVKNYSINHVSK